MVAVPFGYGRNNDGLGGDGAAVRVQHCRSWYLTIPRDFLAFRMNGSVVSRNRADLINPSALLPRRLLDSWVSAGCGNHLAKRN